MATKATTKKTNSVKKAAHAIHAFLRELAKATSYPAERKFYRYALTHGVTFNGRQPSKELAIADEYRKLCQPKMKQCYKNSQKFLFDCEEAEYYEGWFVSPSRAADNLPIPHGWIVMQGGMVIDFTAEAMETHIKRKYGEVLPDPAAYLYLGLSIPREYVIRSILEKREFGPHLREYVDSIGVN